MAVATRSKALELYLSTEAVVGQEKARKLMASLLDRQWAVHQGLLERSSPGLLSGRSGTGKTMTANIMCEHLGLAYAETDATRYSEAGYKGLDLQQMFIPLLEAAARIKDGDMEERKQRLGQPTAKHSSVFKRADLDEVVEIAQTGVILLDEFDKWMLRKNHVTGEMDKTIQSDLLKMIEGSIEYVSESDEEIGVQFDTSRVLIICAGAFVGLFQQVARRLHEDADQKRAAMNSEAFAEQIIPEDFERFGLLPELTGRLSRHIFTRPLNVNDLRTIMRREGGLIEEYRSRFESYDCQWAVSEAGEIKLAAIAADHETGARALEYVLARKFDLALYEAAVAENSVKVVFEPSMAKAEIRPQ
jgi:ATP-dependent Clp protease ATP-binding subunit ClpX